MKKKKQPKEAINSRVHESTITCMKILNNRASFKNTIWFEAAKTSSTAWRRCGCGGGDDDDDDINDETTNCQVEERTEKRRKRAGKNPHDEDQESARFDRGTTGQRSDAT